MVTAAAAFAQDAETLIKQVKDKLDKVRDYKAQALIKTDVPFIRMPQSAVDVYYKRPDKLRVKKEGGVSVLPKEGISININTLLSGNQFTAVPGGDAQLAGAPVKVIKLLPADENSDILLITFYIDHRNLLIRKATTTSRSNGTYDMEMEYGRYEGWGLPDKVSFVFNLKEYNLPKGMTLDYEGGTRPPPSKAKQSQKGKIEVSYLGYEINKGVPDAVFADKAKG